jgi:cytochrome c oxidase assembly protein subunit 15
VFNHSTERSLNQASYNSAHHKFTIFFAACVFLLIVAGALVTSNDAGLAVPDWPTSFGSFVKIPPMVGGVKYEHGHRMIAQFVGLLTIVFAIWTQRKDPRPWMRKLGWFALSLVVFQGILGGITVLMMLPWYVSSAHALFAQTFFSLVVLFTVFTSRRWIQHQPEPVIDDGNISLRALSVAAIITVYAQLFMGAAFRHNGMHFLPHIIGAGFTTIILLWASIRAISFTSIKPIRGAGIAILALLFLQLALGFGAYLTRVEWGKDAVQPMPSMVATTVAHVAIGAVLLAHCFMLTVQSFRNTGTEPITTAEQKVLIS